MGLPFTLISTELQTSITVLHSKDKQYCVKTIRLHNIHLCSVPSEVGMCHDVSFLFSGFVKAV